jgi:hypothetical protein
MEESLSISAPAITDSAVEETSKYERNATKKDPLRRRAVSVCQHQATSRCNSETRFRTYETAASKRQPPGRSGERKTLKQKR